MSRQLSSGVRRASRQGRPAGDALRDRSGRALSHIGSGRFSSPGSPGKGRPLGTGTDLRAPGLTWKGSLGPEWKKGALDPVSPLPRDVDATKAGESAGQNCDHFVALEFV